MKQILILEPLLNTYYNSLFFKSREPHISTLRAITLLKKEFDVVFLDFKTDNVSKKSLHKEIINSKYLFINVKSYNLKLSTEIIAESIKLNKELIIFAFGQYAEYNPEFFFEKSSKIHVIIGELYEFAARFCYLQKENNNITFNSIEKSKSSMDMDQIPKIDLLEMKKRDYYTVYPLKTIKKYKWAFMNLSEGCPHNCVFCSQALRISHGKSIRNFSEKEAIDRIIRVLDSGFNAIRFIDDDFLANREFVQNLCKRLIRSNLDFRWMAQVRADKIDKTTIALMKKAGCECLNFGIESASDSVLKILKKGETIKQMKNAAILCRKEKMLFVAYFMIGSPTETISDINNSINLSFELKPDMLQVCYFTSYEGSVFYLKNKKKISSSINQQKFHYFDICHNFSKVPNRILMKIWKRWYLWYYLNNILKIIRILILTYLFYPRRVFDLIKLCINIRKKK